MTLFCLRKLTRDQCESKWSGKLKFLFPNLMYLFTILFISIIHIKTLALSAAILLKCALYYQKCLSNLRFLSRIASLVLIRVNTTPRNSSATVKTTIFCTRVFGSNIRQYKNFCFLHCKIIHPTVSTTRIRFLVDIHPYTSTLGHSHVYTNIGSHLTNIPQPAVHFPPVGLLRFYLKSTAVLSLASPTPPAEVFFP